MAFLLRLSNRTWLLIGAGLALVLFLATLQTTINGSNCYCAMDSGEIQNALPHWGTIHEPGYPQYMLTGSLLVTFLRLVGIAPAAGASLVSALWGTVAVGLFILLAHELGAPMPAAVVGAWLAAFSTSMWLDASLAEIHTLTMTLAFATLWFAVRFGRNGQRRDLLWLTFFFTQSVIHQRSGLFMAPAVAVLIAPYLRTVRQHLRRVIGMAILAPLAYFYPLLRVWMNASWIFTRKWWEMLTDNQAKKIVQIPTELSEWWDRLELSLDILNDDLSLPLIALGLIGLLLLTWSHSRREAVGLTLGWLPYYGLSLVVWEGYVSDALLAVKLPVLPLAGCGLALVLGWISDRFRGLRGETGFRMAGAILLVAGLVMLGIRNYPKITAVTRNPDAEENIRLAEQVAPPPDDRPAALVAFWGNQYWQLSYAQAFQGRLPGLDLVKHFDNLRKVLADHGRVWILSPSLYTRPVSYWEGRLGQQVALGSVAPGVIQMTATPQTESADALAEPVFDFGNGIRIVGASPSVRPDGQLLLRIIWQAIDTPVNDYGVSVELVASDASRGAKDVVARVRYQHPVEGFYPTSRWTAGESVVDHFLIEIPPASRPLAVRVALYHRGAAGSFHYSPWLELPIVSN